MLMVLPVGLLVGTTHAQIPDSLWYHEYSLGWESTVHSLLELPDGGYSLAGVCVPVEGEDDDFLLVRTDADGEMLWAEIYGGSGDDVCYSHEQTGDGGFILAGLYMDEDEEEKACLIKTDAAGNLEWEATYGDTCYTCANAVLQTSGGGFVFLGEISPPSGGGNWLVKTDSDGNLEWQVLFDPPSGGTSSVDLEQTPDGGYILLVNRGSHYFSDAVLIKTDSNGAEEWESSFGFATSNTGKSVLVCDPGFAVLVDSWDVGDISRFSGTSLVRVDDSGNEEWCYQIPSSTNSAFDHTSDNGFVLVGDIYYAGLYSAGFNELGELLWFTTFDVGVPKCVVHTVDGGYAIAGNTYLFKIGPDTGIEGAEPDSYPLHVTVSPNPFMEGVSLSFTLSDAGLTTMRIFDLTGRCVATPLHGILEPGQHRTFWDGSNLDGSPVPSGVYLVELSSNGQVPTTVEMVCIH